jgi:ferritin-like metal-binding protein YciE
MLKPVPSKRFAPGSKVGHMAFGREGHERRGEPPAALHVADRKRGCNEANCGCTKKGMNVMGFFSKDIKTMGDLFVHTLRDIYYAEKQIVQALPEMIDKARYPQLKQGFQTHLGETKQHVTRLEQVFRLHGNEPRMVDCPAIDGIIDEAEDVAGEVEDKSVLDAALIAAAQAVEHYEITRYGTLIAWAKELGRNDCAALLQQNLDEEKATDKKLTAMAESKLNRRAA